MKNQTSSFLTVLSLILFLSFVSTGCQKNGADIAAGSKGISLFLTDDPSVIFDNIFVDIQKVEVKAEDDAEAEREHGHENEIENDDHNGSTSGGWITLASKPGVYDILKFRNGLDTLFSTGSFQSIKSLKKVRITLGNNNTAVLNGVTSALTLKKNIVVINLEEEMVEQKNGDRVNLLLDLDAGRSVRRHGNGFEFEPGMKAFTKDKAGSIEGRVTPSDAKAIVMAINGTDTATAKPEREGEFKIIGLKAGIYKLVAHPTANNYVDATISNINVRTKEDSNVGTITLHK
jgi:hypothetical protein